MYKLECLSLNNLYYSVDVSRIKGRKRQNKYLFITRKKLKTQYKGLLASVRKACNSHKS